MKIVQLFLLCLAVLAGSTTQAFSVQPITRSSLGGGSGFVVSQRPQHHQQQRRSTYQSKSQLYMGGKNAKFGIFSPAVYAAKFVLGTDKLIKFRGKAISLHSSYIGDFCLWVGAYHMRVPLIKKAKANGDILGFLV